MSNSSVVSSPPPQAGVGAACDQDPRTLFASPMSSSLTEPVVVDVEAGSATTPPAKAPPATPPTHLRLKEVIYTQSILQRPLNTKKAVDPKVKEWYQYCDHVYPKVDVPDRYVLCSENTYQFMVFQAMRPKKDLGGKLPSSDDGSGGKKKRKRKSPAVVVNREEGRAVGGGGGEVVVVSTGKGLGFSSALYDSVMHAYSDAQTFVKGDDVGHPENAIGYSLLVQYKAALIAIHRAQCSCTNKDVLFTPTIWTQHHIVLMDLVNGRKNIVSRLAFEEKMMVTALPTHN